MRSSRPAERGISSAILSSGACSTIRALIGYGSIDSERDT
jgi:hypothetical protein